jgi:hypothetical protein
VTDPLTSMDYVLPDAGIAINIISIVLMSDEPEGVFSGACRTVSYLE